ncbi:hypothetical protein PILCRDRAFT_821279 [Piloderma croceum F 1598]|uniref:Protein kinase domain-containing protein n=1 Tax=Piloderma croceum (strain F 1598) TaxID=765440 RepID=A0A0C3B5G8_PILCF|nr:hypothetical protein PILCRDRAFT_821279 [Piloderma croceum F 1598]
MPSRFNPPAYPEPVRPSVKELTADRSLLDITQHINTDLPVHKHAIGHGACGNVYRGIYRWIDPESGETQNLNVVIKYLVSTRQETPKIEERLNREIATWRHLKHPNVSEFLGICRQDSGLPPGMVSRYVLRYDFLAYIGRRPELKRKKAQEIACGLEYLHENHVVHGDLKVNNILISDYQQAQITDFGLARILDVQGFTTMTFRNVRYAAPELRPIQDVDMRTVRPTTRSDIFSLGILFLQLFHGPDQDTQRGLPYNHIPFSPNTGDYPLLVRIHSGERPRRELYEYMYDQHWSLIERCWAGNPSERPSIAEVLEDL